MIILDQEDNCIFQSQTRPKVFIHHSIVHGGMIILIIKLIVNFYFSFNVEYCIILQNLVLVRDSHLISFLILSEFIWIN